MKRTFIADIAHDALPYLDPLNTYEHAQLNELPDPAAVSWWPQTAGWWWLLLGVAVCLFLVLRKCWIIHQKNTWRRDALIELKAMEKAGDLTQLNSLIKRIGLLFFPRRKIAGSNHTDVFHRLGLTLTQDQSLLITSSTYKCNKPINPYDDLFVIIERWIKELPNA
ncbi:DUF4381 domain-containing protein [Endozoicomonas sp.]|uniref:DUF4381 domain-containing protein n=1 Tax=Endozoicomonas sp. TaxID=1892382 RepID=UPI002885E099|nr:DUF4381 domain-containing protein [Endozoicomonas sp.]